MRAQDNYYALFLSAESSPPRPRPDIQEGELPLEYDKCEFSTKYAKNLKVHKRILNHLGIPYQC